MSLISASDGDGEMRPLPFIFTAVMPAATCSATWSATSAGSSPPTHA